MDASEPAGTIRPTKVKRLLGAEPFVGLDVAGEATVADFWSWAYSDLRDNLNRGVLAEFLVAHAIGARTRLRQSWDNYDLEATKGKRKIRVEVKASGYLQSWPQAKLSTLNFGKLIGLPWDENTGQFGPKREVKCHVFVFAVHTCKKPTQYRPLEASQWEFSVVPASAVRDAGYRSVGIEFVRTHRSAGPITLAKVPAESEAAVADR